MRRLSDKLVRIGPPRATGGGLGAGQESLPPKPQAGPIAGQAALPGPRSTAERSARRTATGDRSGDRIARLREMIRSCGAESRSVSKGPARQSGHGPVAVLPGCCVDTKAGPLRRIEHVLEPEYHHGRVAVARALGVRGSTLSALARDERWSSVDPRRLLYLDTETTGLSRGAGTLAFIIGLASFEDESLVVEQLVLEEPGLERPMLVRLSERLGEASGVVTYNGRAYDWPLLSTRFVLNQVAVPSLPPHLDLLTAARRVYRPRLGGVRLVRMEEEVLGMRRERDIDGAEIPELFWSFVRRRDGTELRVVMEHNAHDLAALAALLGCFADRYERLHPADDPRDHLGWARLALGAQQDGRALDFARAAAEGGGTPELTARAYLFVAEAHRKTGEWAESRSALETVVEVAPRGGVLAAQAHLALAKLFEHRFKDPAAALRHAQYTAGSEDLEAHRRRVARLAGRLTRLSRAGRGRAASGHASPGQPPRVERWCRADGGGRSEPLPQGGELRDGARLGDGPLRGRLPVRHERLDLE